MEESKAAQNQTENCHSEFEASPVVFGRLQRQAPFSMESPQKYSAVKASLAVRLESVEKGADSILGESPSPSKQIDRFGWTLDSPDKLVCSPPGTFALKLDRVAHI